MAQTPKPCAPCALAGAFAGGARAGSTRAGGTRASGAAAGTRAGAAVANALAGVTTTPDECAEDVQHAPGTPCATRKALGAIAEFVVAVAPSRLEARDRAATARDDAGAKPKRREPLLPTAPTPEAEAVRAAAAALGCDSESCVLAHPDLRSFVVKKNLMTPAELKAELEVRYKTAGPRDTLALTSNFNLDGTLQHWARVFPEFFPCPFAMMDFDKYDNVFGEVDLPSVLEGRVAADLGPVLGRVRRRATCFGCILNTDTSRQPGRHWVAVFVDCRPAEAGGAWSVEYFNSAGNPPPKAMAFWLERTRARLQNYRETSAAPRGPVRAVAVTDMDHQESQTECGLYALFYIRRRLEGEPYASFMDRDRLIPDAAMTVFRTHVFRRA